MTGAPLGRRFSFARQFLEKFLQVAAQDQAPPPQPARFQSAGSDDFIKFRFAETYDRAGLVNAEGCGLNGDVDLHGCVLEAWRVLKNLGGH